MTGLSKLVFGHERSLALQLAIGRSGEASFTLTDLATILGVENPSAVQRPLSALNRAGFIERLPRRPTERTQPYARINSMLWELAEELASRSPDLEWVAPTPVDIPTLF